MSKIEDLEFLLSQQTKMMRALGILEAKGDVADEMSASRPALLEAAIGMSVEAAEVLDELNKQHRPWVDRDTKTESLIIEETIDVLFYVLEIFVLLRLPGEQIKRLYIDKYRRNLLRIISSYDEQLVQGVRQELLEGQESSCSILSFAIRELSLLELEGEG